jgi:hypothetical protein
VMARSAFVAGLADLLAPHAERSLPRP